MAHFQTVAFLFLLPHLLYAQIPAACEGLLECCPTPDAELIAASAAALNITYEVTAQPCGAGYRGQCVSVNQIPNVNIDVCKEGILQHFRKVCVCYGNFAGVDCSLCKFGWSGINCNVPTMRYRRSFQNYTQEEKNQFRDDIMLMKFATNPDFVTDRGTQLSYMDYFAYLHNKVSGFRGIDWAHEGSGFPTWHRWELLTVERGFQRVLGRPDWTMPYWDWTAPDAMEVIEFFGGNGTEDFSWLGGRVLMPPWDQWGIIGEHGIPVSPDPHLRRCVGCDPSLNTLPSREALEYTLAAPLYDAEPYDPTTDCGYNAPADCVVPEMYSFRNALQGFSVSATHLTLPALPEFRRDMHNRVHIFVGGYMGQVPYAGNDPLFFLHHAFVDFIFEQWLRRHPDTLADGFVPVTGAQPGHNRHDCIYPWFPVITHNDLFKPTLNFGYDYI